MKAELIYVELKSGYNDNGPAWIGNGFYNRTRKTIYFNGQVFSRGTGTSANHFDIESGEDYWISGIKKDGTDRHWAGSGKIQIDKGVVDEYLSVRGLSELRKDKYDLVVLNNTPAIDTSVELKNEKATEVFDHTLTSKDIMTLTDGELNQLSAYYESLDLPSIPKNSRKGYIESMNQLNELKKARGLQAITRG